MRFFDMQRILCHVGPWSFDHYRFIAKELAPHASLRTVSGHPKYDKAGYFERYYYLLRHLEFSQSLANDRERDIILRCRLLRALPPATALLHLRAAWVAMGEVLDREQPDLILTETIDSYVMDVLYFQALDRGIRFIGLVPTFISGYFRVTSRGEYNLSRDVPNEETNAVLDRLLEKTYRPDFIKNSDSKLAYYALCRWVRNMVKIPYFLIKRLHAHERYNYHNWATLKVSLDWFHFFPSLNIGDAKWKEKISVSAKPIIYIPLQMIPEATVDYWCEDHSAVEYEKYLLKLVERLGESFTLLIKEHPNVLGYRNPRLYRALQKIPAVVVAPTATNSQELIELANAILIWTGSVGFEAAIRGKPVLTTCKPYYQVGSMFKKIDLGTDPNAIKTFLAEFPPQDVNEVRQQLIKHVLSGALPGQYIIDGSWSESNPAHQQHAKNIAQQLKGFVEFQIGLND